MVKVQWLDQERSVDLIYMHKERKICGGRRDANFIPGKTVVWCYDHSLFVSRSADLSTHSISREKDWRLSDFGTIWIKSESLYYSLNGEDDLIILNEWYAWDNTSPLAVEGNKWPWNSAVPYIASASHMPWARCRDWERLSQTHHKVAKWRNKNLLMTNDLYSQVGD